METKYFFLILIDGEDAKSGKEDEAGKTKQPKKRGPKTTIQPNQLTILREQTKTAIGYD